MENIYILNRDCIQCFEIAHHDIYLSILSMSKVYSQRKENVSKLYFYHYFTTCKPINLHCFRNLTYLNVDIMITKDYRIQLDFKTYHEKYYEKYNRCPSLKKLKLRRVSTVKNMRYLSNLEYLDVATYTFSILSFECCTNLTALKYIQCKTNTFKSLSYLNLKMLKITCDTFRLENITCFHSLEKFKLKIPYNVKLEKNNHYTDLYFEIKSNYLTYLAIDNKCCILYVNLNTLTQLKILKLTDGIGVIHREINYYQKASQLETLKLKGIANVLSYEVSELENCRLILSHKYNNKLKHLELNHFDYVWLDRMTNLKTNNIQEVKRLKIDDNPSIRIMVDKIK